MYVFMILTLFFTRGASLKMLDIFHNRFLDLSLISRFPIYRVFARVSIFHYIVRKLKCF